ncbi:putative DNA polymerase I [Vibrio phage Ares1]|nr:putative DNA polymerase I [Vibrio phage Ares1]
MQHLNDFLNNLHAAKTFSDLPSYDFSKLEERAAASMVKQGEVITGEDIHAKMACAIFGLALCDVREKHRRFAKNENFKQIYSFRSFDNIVYPDTPTHCRTCLNPLSTNDPQIYNECVKCEGV